uniref:Rab-GAP TBC domain-containing protein n=1 Tax=Spongospora subterranea TaxID=70186 RepID=A0A0H5QXE6_9EUKA|eukprot:CRZ06402.1 hypothetical protein [Spongospora subterranea]
MEFADVVKVEESLDLNDKDVEKETGQTQGNSVGSLSERPPLYDVGTSESFTINVNNASEKELQSPNSLSNKSKPEALQPFATRSADFILSVDSQKLSQQTPSDGLQEHVSNTPLYSGASKSSIEPSLDLSPNRNIQQRNANNSVSPVLRSRSPVQREDDMKSDPQATNFKVRGRVFFQGLVDNWAGPSAASIFIDSEESQDAQRERQTKEDRIAWGQMFQNWNNRTEIPSQRKLRNMCWRGIPSSCRSQAWIAIIGNDLKITNDLYNILSSRQTSAASDSCSREDSMNLIEIDVPRTFPDLQFFHGEGPLKTPLINILRTYVSFRPDVGYTQGMSYIAAMLLLNVDSEYHAFQALANLLNRELYFTLFRDFTNGRTHLNVFDKLLKKHVFKASERFQELQLTPDMYLYDWILTIFSRSFPLDIACRIWDCFLVEGQAFLFRAALGVLKMYESVFASSSFEQCLHFLNRIPKNLDERTLFNNILNISVSEKTLNRMLIQESSQN